MRPMTKRTLFLLAVTTVFLLTVSGTAQAQAAVTTHSGSLADGAKYLIEVPANCNGTLFLYSHGYVVPGTPNPPQDFAKMNPSRDFSCSPRDMRWLGHLTPRRDGQSKTRCGTKSPFSTCSTWWSVHRK